jgi:hypothetical protein
VQAESKADAKAVNYHGDATAVADSKAEAEAHYGDAKVRASVYSFLPVIFKARVILPRSLDFVQLMACLDSSLVVARDVEVPHMSLTDRHNEKV